MKIIIVITLGGVKHWIYELSKCVYDTKNGAAHCRTDDADTLKFQMEWEQNDSDDVCIQ